MKNLYNSLIEAKRHCGEPTEDLSFPKFHRLIASKADGIKQQRGCERVRFSVTVEMGHVSFKARAEGSVQNGEVSRQDYRIYRQKKRRPAWSPFLFVSLPDP